jgi:peroxiredoxin
MRIIVGIIILAIVGFAGYKLINKLQVKQSASKRIKQMPAFAFTDLQGQPFSSSQLSNDKSTVIIYFHTECDHCQYEAESIVKESQKFNNTQVLFISSQKLPDINAFGTKYGLLAHDNIKLLKDSANAFYNVFGTMAVPCIFVYAKDGALLKSFSGETKMEAILDLINGK